MCHIGPMCKGFLDLNFNEAVIDKIIIIYGIPSCFISRTLSLKKKKKKKPISRFRRPPFAVDRAALCNMRPT